jgi:hypothetical protein
LNESPKQKKDLNESLEKLGKEYQYSRDRLNDLLNLMIDSGDIERTFIKNNPYPVYAVIKKSKLLAEFNGIQFGRMFSYGLLKPELNDMLMKEFEFPKQKRTQLNALLEYFGFIVLGSLLASRLYDKEIRSDWLKPVLDLERSWMLSKFFDSHIHEEKLEYMVEELLKKYPENMDILDRAVNTSNEMKEIVEKKGEGLEKMFKDFVDEHKEDLK